MCTLPFATFFPYLSTIFDAERLPFHAMHASERGWGPKLPAQISVHTRAEDDRWFISGATAPMHVPPVQGGRGSALACWLPRREPFFECDLSPTDSERKLPDKNKHGHWQLADCMGHERG